MIRFIFVSVIILLLEITSFSKASPWQNNVSKKSIKGIATIAQSIIADTFTPMTHYKKGDISSSFVPSYFSIDKVLEDPSVEADNLNGSSLGLGFGYALTENLLFYFIAAGLDMNGGINGEFYGKGNGFFDADIDYNLFNLYMGVGYDIYRGDDFSVPFYLGIGFMRYDMNVKIPDLNVTAPVAYNLGVDIYGSDNLYNLSTGVTLSYNMTESLKTSLYFLYTRSLNKPGIYAEVEQSGVLTYEEKEYHELDEIDTSMIGINITFRSSDEWSFSINAGSSFATLSGFNNLYNEGMEIYSIVASITFTTSLTE